ncbi:C39 family peptidase [Streptomyces sp. NPDC087859]|uniref:C39 family peptidase n=1 Tax=Streptomyces sp. NPDC087859 TaxID=3365812 RepID=UPI003802F3AF
MLPLCCADSTDTAPRPVHAPVPIVTQYATADLIGHIAYDGHDPAHDCAWDTTGAPTQSAYARWCRHMCGIACLRMALLHRDGQAPSLFKLLTGARHYNAYVQQTGGDIKGLIYAPFAQYVQATHALWPSVHPELDVRGLVTLLDAGHMVMASVSKEIRRPELEPEKRGGHLVLAIGHQDGAIHFRNPSGHTPQAREAALPVDHFKTFFGGRGISLNMLASRHRAARPLASQAPRR